MPNQILTPEVAAVLSRGSTNGNLFVVPNNPDGSRLDRELYVKVDAALVKAGGRWNTRSKGHVFDGNPRDKLASMLETGVAIDEAGNHKKKLQAFFTSKIVADEIARLAEVKGHYVLEPSAGRGALVEACARAGARGICCIEIDPESAASLKADGLPDVTCGDFLAMKPSRVFSRIVMNPPFSKKQAIKHVWHALDWLDEDGILFAIMPPNQADEIAPKLGCLEYGITSLPKDSFKDSGTRIETCLLRVMRG